MQKSGYFARSAPANVEDQRLIQGMVDLAVSSGLAGESGVVGHDEDQNDRLRTIEFTRIKGGKPLDIASALVHAAAEGSAPARRPRAVSAAPLSDDVARQRRCNQQEGGRTGRITSRPA